jgi:hypothetical protein
LTVAASSVIRIRTSESGVILGDVHSVMATTRRPGARWGGRA